MAGGKKQEARQLDRMMVRIDHLDTLLNLVGEVIITSNNIGAVNRRVQEFYDTRTALDKTSMDMVKATEIISHRISSDLHSLVMAIRMVEVRSTFQRFRRAVRDMAKESGKQVELVTVGEETLVDKTIAEKLYDPINHQIRNSIDHGVEEPLERQRLGKDVKAKLTLRAYQKENNIFIEIQDDGRGIDPEAVAQAAVKRGLFEQDEAARMSREEKINIIFHPGFSTKASASRISGRGVGMDVVKSNIEELGGEVTLETRVGEGTTFTYRIPQVTAVNIVDCLTVRAGKNYYAIPILNVISTMGITPSQISTAFGKGRTIMYLGSLVTLFDLNELLSEAPIDEEGEITVVIVEAKNGRVALRVSELMSPEKLVFTPLADIFRVQGVSGTTTMSGNKMGLILDVFELVNRSKGISPGAESAEEEAGAEGAAAFEAYKTLKEAAEEKEEAGKEFLTDIIALSSDVGREISHREEFMVELEDIIKSLDESILSLENNPGDMELVNKVFRDFHSMKGNLMMVGLAELGGFIHEVETILDRARGGTLEVGSEIIDILLDSVDTIKEARQALSRNEAPVIDKSLLRNLDKYKKPEEEKKLEPVDVHQRTFHLGSLERFNLMAQKYSGRHIYQIFLSIKPVYQQPFLVALLILKRLTRIGHVFGSVPAVDEIESQRIESQIKVMISSPLAQDELNGFIKDVLVKYYDVQDYEILKTS